MLPKIINEYQIYVLNSFLISSVKNCVKILLAKKDFNSKHWNLDLIIMYNFFLPKYHVLNNKTQKLGQKSSQKLILCTVLVFHKGIFYSKKDVFNWDYDSSKFYKLLYSKKEKGSSSFFFRRFFFSLAQLSYEYISLGFFAGFLFFLVSLLFVFPWILQLSCSLFFSEPRGQKQKHYFFFSCLFCFLLVIFFSF